MRRPTPLVIEALEPRILYSADSPLALAAGIAAPDGGNGDKGGKPVDAAPAAVYAAMQATATAGEQQQVQRHEIVFIDGAVSGAQDLARQIAAGSDATRSLDVVVIDAGRDGISQITEALNGYRDLSAIHIISHGEAGALQLGNARLDEQSLLGNAVAVSQWGSALSSDGDILLYGCDVAANEAGQDFIASLAQLTGADIAASTDLTGAAALGGDWTLEYTRGQVETAVAPAAATQANYSGVLATYTVTKTIDDGSSGTLRWAIGQANTNAGADTINFNIGSGAKTINLTSELTHITDAVTIDGTTQPGYAGAPLIQLDGTNAGVGANGLYFYGANTTGSLVRGLVLSNFDDDAIEVDSASNVTIQGNYIGTNLAGTVANANSYGIYVHSSANVTIGGTTSAERNVISGNTYPGIYIASASGTVIQGNYIGTNAAGTDAIGNYSTNPDAAGLYVWNSNGVQVIGNVVSGNVKGMDFENSGNNTIQGNYVGTNASGDTVIGNSLTGLYFLNSSGNTIGGTTAAARNVISGNGTAGILLDTGAESNTISGNYIGTNAAGTAGLGNFGRGIYIFGSNNMIGGSGAGAGNIIAYNDFQGIDIDTTNGAVNGVTILGNSIYSNGNIGIDLNDDGVTVNDAGDADTGGNDLQNFAVLTGAFVNGGNVTIVGSLNSTASTTYRIEFFASTGTNTSGYGEGQRYLGYATVTTDASNNAAFSTTLAASVAAGEFVSATVTDNTTNQTSEFSQAVKATSWTGTVGTRYIVSNTNDSGAGSLRQAILDANASAGLDTIIFNIGTGAQTITPASALPTVTEAVVIDARTQPGYGAAPIIELAGTTAGTGVNGFSLNSSVNGGAIRGLVINRFQGSGITLSGSSNVMVQGNYIGTNAAGTAASGNTNYGVQLSNSAAGNLIGGTNVVDRNVLSGNADSGVALLTSSTGNFIQGNYLGTNATGMAAIPNVRGVYIVSASGNTIGGTAAGAGNLISGNFNHGVRIQDGNNNSVQGNYIGVNKTGTAKLGNANYGVYILGTSSNNLIGGTTAGARNIISGNGDYGILMSGSNVKSNLVQGNYIGTNAAGTSALGNGSIGIRIDSASKNNTIGGTAAGAGNVISGNTKGIEIDGNGTGSTSGNTIQGNFIGTNAAGTSGIANTSIGVRIFNVGSNNTIGGTTAGAGNVIAYNGKGITIGSGTGNAIEGNRIYSNTGLGIDVGDDGVTANDAGDGDTGANNLQNFPVISTVYLTGASITITGTYNGAASKTLRIELFASDAKDASGNGEGQIYLGYVDTTTDASGNATFTFTGTGASAGQYISATATDYATNDTSEFAVSVRLNSPPVIVSNGGGANAAVSVAENNTAVTTVIATDSDGDTPAFSISGGADAAKFNIDSATGVLRFITAPNFEAPGDADANNVYVVQVSASDGKGATGTQVISVTVDNINDAPAGADNTVSTNEDTAYTFTAADFGFNDIDGNQFQSVEITSIAGGGTLTNNGAAVHAGDFVLKSEIDASKLVFTPAANANGNGYASFTFQVQDNGGTARGGIDLDQSPNTMTINVAPVNDAPSGIDKTVSTNEDTAYTFTAADFAFSDIEGNALLAVKITTVPGAGTLTNNGATVQAGDVVTKASIDAGKLKFTPAANANGTGYASFTFQVQDDGGVANGGTDLDPSANTMTIDVASVNDAPAGTDKTVSTNEDTAYTFTATDFGFNDVDSNAFLAVKITTVPGAGTLTNNGATVNAGDFVSKANIDAGKLKFTPVANANGTGYASFTFQVQDDGGTARGGIDLDASANTMTIDVVSVNDAPSGTDKTVSTNEDTAYTFTATDFGFSDIDGNAFLSVKITTVPGAGTLTNNGTAVNAGDFVSKANIDAGSLKFTPATNANGTGYASFTFQVKDDGGTANGGADLDATPNTLTINVASVNDAPAGTDKTVSTNEDTAYTFTATDFGFSDVDGNAFLSVKITTVPGAGTLTNNGTTLNAGDFVSKANIDAGLLKFTPVANANGNGYASFTFQVRDDGGTANGGADLDASANTMTINVVSVNDAPSGSDKTVSTNEDTAYTFTATDFGFSDTDGNALLSVKITTVPGAGTLTNNGTTVNAGDFVSKANIDAGLLKFTPAANANGTGYASFTFQVRDDGGTANGGADLDASANTMTIDVVSVNDAPAGTDKTVSTNEDTAYTFTAIDFGFSDIDGNAFLSVKITTVPGAGTLTNNGVAVNAGDFVSKANIDAGLLKFTPAANANGTGYASFTFQVRDDGGTANGGADLDATPNTMTINVASVNDAPAGADKTVSTNEDTAYTFTAADFGFSDTDGNALLAVKITTVPGAGTLTDNGAAVHAGDFVTKASIDAGKLKFTPAINANGTGYASFTFQVQDDGGVANGGADLDASANTMTIDVASVNDAPAGTDKTVSTNEDTAYTFTAPDFGFSDVDGNAFLSVKITTVPGAGTLTNNGTTLNAGDFVSKANIDAGLLKFTPAANANGNGYASFTFQVRDDGGTANGGTDLDASANTMTIDIVSVNDAPSGSEKTVSTNEDTAYTFTATDFGFSDTDGNAFLSVKITAVPGAGTLTNNGTTVNAGDFVSKANIDAGLLKFTPAANANGTGYASFTFQVRDDGGTANGGADLDASANTMTIDVVSVNDAPAGTDKTVSTNEDTAYTFTANDFGFSDTDGNAFLSVKITTVPGAGTLTNNGAAINAGDFITKADIDASLLKFTPAANANGTGYASFTFQVRDDGGTANGGTDLDASANTMTIDVASVNDAPSGTDKTVSTHENAAYTFTAADFGFSDVDSNAFLSVKITTVPGAGTLTDNGAVVHAGDFVTKANIDAGLLKFTPAANANGTGYASFTFQVKDDGGTASGGVDLDASANTMTIDVIAINHAPAGTDKTVSTNEDAAYTFTAADFGFSDTDGNALLAVKITTMPGAGTLTDNGAAVHAGDFVSKANIDAGLLKFTPAANANGNGYASFTFQVRDDGGTANGGADLDASANTMTIDVASVNDAPAGSDKTVSTNEDIAYTFTAADFGFSDSDGNAFLSVKITTVPGAGMLTNNGATVNAGDVVTKSDIDAGLLKFTPVANAHGAGYASFTFQVRDDGGTANGGADLDATPNTMTIDVASVNDAPAGADKTVSTNEDTAYIFTAADFGFSDTDGNAFLSVKITTAPGAGTLTNNGVAVNAGDFVSKANIDAGKLKFMPAANANGTGYASFTFQVQDDGGTARGGIDLDQSANTMTIDVVSVNDAPSGTDKTVNTNENAAYTFTAADFGFSDIDGNAFLSIKITTIPATGTLTNDGLAVNAGDFVTKADIDAHKLVFTPANSMTGYVSFTFQVRDDGGTANGGADLDTAANTMTVGVAAINHAPAGADKTVSTNEDIVYTFTAADFGFSDTDGNAFLSVKITTVPGAGTLTNNGAAVNAGDFVSWADIDAGLLKFTPAANASGAGYASFTFQVQDDGGIANGGTDLDASANTMTINVASVNDAPAGTDKTVSTNEDTAYTFTATDFGFSDVDSNAFLAVKITTVPGAGTLTDNGVAVNAGDFVSKANIDAGKLKFTPAANANGTGYASFTFQVQDDGGTARSGIDLDQSANTMTIDVVSVNDAPSGADKTVSTHENAAYTFTAADFGFSDTDGNALLAVKITTVPGAGTLINNGAAVNAGDFVSKANIDAGLLKFTPAANANGTGYASFTFQVQDDGGVANGGTDLDASANTMTIDVIAINHAPAGTDKTVSTNEDAAYTFTAADFGFSDTDGNALLAVKITTMPGAGTLTDNGAAVHAGDFVSKANIDAGLLKFTPATNANGNGYASFTFQVEDDGGVANGGADLDASANTLTIDVASVNDAPTGTDKTVSTNEDVAYTFTAADFGFSDTDGNAFLSVKITTVPGAGALTNNGAAINAGDFITKADIDAGLLKFTPTANANGNGYASFTFQVRDDGGTANGGTDLDASANTMTIDVASVNDAPSGTDKTVSTHENAAYTFTAADFGFSDVDGNAFLSVKITTVPGAGTLTDNGAAVHAGDFVTKANIDAGLLKFTPAANANGTGYASFTFQVKDDGGTASGGVDLDASANTMTINVTAINHAPSGTDNTVSTNEDAAYTFTAVDFGFSDTDGNALLAVKITTVPGAGTLTDNGATIQVGDFVTKAHIDAGLLKFTPASNANGNGYASFTFQVQDDGGTVNGGANLDASANTMTIDVASVNDAPSGADNTVSTNEDTAYTFTAADFGFSDTDGNALLAVKITTVPGAGTLTDNGTVIQAGDFVTRANIDAGLLKFTPAADAHGTGYASFTFQVQDDGGTANGGIDLNASAHTMTIDVASVNDAPSGSDTTVSTNEDVAYTFTAADFGFSDTDGNALLSVKITTVPGAGTLTNNGTAVNAGDFVSKANIDAGLLKFMPAANANGTGYASFTFQVRDDGGIANGGADLDTSANTLTINVVPVNDAPAGADKTVSTNEDTAYIFTAADFGFSDSDGNAFLSVKITTVPGAGTLTNNGAAINAGDFVTKAEIDAGLLKFTPAANANGNGYASFTFQVRDDGGGADLDASANTMTIDVVSVNDAPSGTDKTVHTNENAPYTFTAADFGFSDADGNSLLSVKISTVPATGTLTNNGALLNAGDVVTKAELDAGKLVFTPASNMSGNTSFTFQVQDDGGTANGGSDLDASANTLTVSVAGINHAPAGSDKTVTTDEDTAYTFTATDFGFSDMDGNALLAVKITTVPGAGTLTDNGTVIHAGDFVTRANIDAGLLKFTPAADANGSGYASFTFQVQDDGGTANGGADLDASANTITVDVTSINDAPSGTDNTVSTNEDTAYTFTATDFGFSDIDGNAFLSVKITSLPAAGTLTNSGAAVNAGDFVTKADIDAGLFKFTPAANANGAGYAAFTFQVKDNGGTSGGGADLDPTPNTISINVASVNDAPAGTDKTVNTNENVPYVFTAADFGFSDTDGNAFLSVQITSVPGAGTLTNNGATVNAGDAVTKAEIDAGKLVFTPATNASGYTNFTFQVRDDGGTANGGVDLDASANTMTIGVAAINHAPAGTDKTVATNEDTAYTFTAADFGFNDTDGNAFLSVKITTVPGAGTLSSNGAAVNAGDFVSKATIDAGLLKFTPAANANGAGYASFTFQVKDDGGTANGGADLDASAHTLTVNVNAVNDAPAGSNKTVNTSENTAYTFTAADFGFSDTDGNAFIAVKITTAPGTGTLTNDGAVVNAGDFVTKAELDAGKLVFTPASNVSGNTSFTFQVQDDGGIANGGSDLDSSANTMTIGVATVNHAPAGADNTISTSRNTSYTFTAADFGFSDADGNALLAVTISTLPGTGTMTNNGAAVNAGDVITKADIDLGRLVFTPAANMTGNVAFTFQVQDDGGTANGGVDLDPSANTLTISVGSANHAPGGTDKIVNTNENAAYAFTAADFGFSDMDGNAFLAVKITTIPATGTLTNNGVAVNAGDFVTKAAIDAGKLVFTPAANMTGNTGFTFQVQDDGGTANGGSDLDPSANTMTISVAFVNDAPDGADKTVNTKEDAAYIFTASDFGFSDMDGNAFLSVRIATVPGAGTLTNNGVAVHAGDFISRSDIDAGKLQFLPAANANGNGYASFTFQVRDDGGTANGGIDLDPTPNTLTLNVTPVNDAPSGADKTVTTLEDTAYIFTAADFGFTDANDTPANNFVSVKITTMPNAGTLTNNGVLVHAGGIISKADIDAGLLKFMPAANDNGAGYASFTFQVRDDGGTANGGVDLDPTPNTLTLDVTPVNDEPSGIDKTVATLEDTPYIFKTADFSFVDIDRNGLAAITVVNLPRAGSLLLDGVAVTQGQRIAAADIAAGKLAFMAAPNANGAGYAAFEFQVQDDGGTANGGVDLDSTPNTLTIDVISVNDAPSGTDNMIHLSWDTRYTFAPADFGFTDIDGNNFAAVTITELPTAGTLTLGASAVHAGQSVAVADIAAGRLRFMPELQFSGSPYVGFSFRVQDDGGTANGGADIDTTTRTFTVHLMPAPEDVHAHADSGSEAAATSAGGPSALSAPARNGAALPDAAGVRVPTSEPVFTSVLAPASTGFARANTDNASILPWKHHLRPLEVLREVQATSSYGQESVLGERYGVHHVIITLDELLRVPSHNLAQTGFAPAEPPAGPSASPAPLSGKNEAGSNGVLPMLLAVAEGTGALTGHSSGVRSRQPSARKAPPDGR